MQAYNRNGDDRRTVMSSVNYAGGNSRKFVADYQLNTAASDEEDVFSDASQSSSQRI